MSRATGDQCEPLDRGDVHTEGSPGSGTLCRTDSGIGADVSANRASQTSHEQLVATAILPTGRRTGHLSMRGIIFNVIEEGISAEHGMQTWDALLTSADLAGGYSSLGDYPDEELHRLIAVGSAALGMTPRDLTRHFGQSALLALSDASGLLWSSGLAPAWPSCRGTPS